MVSISPFSIINFCVIYFGYTIFSLLLTFYYYYYRSDVKSVSEWKIQPNKSSNTGSIWGIPILSDKKNRGPYHKLFTTLNLFVASTFALVMTECSVRGINRMSFESPSSFGLNRIFFEFCIAVIHENIVEYIWHLIMHTRFCYTRFHKFHHFYKAPEPFDDMYIHPVEAFGYYCILYSPPFLYSCHLCSFLAYMVLMGICGILDHSGVKLSLPGIYETLDHDAHHAKFEVNYGFPFVYLDLLFGTYEGTFLGMKINRRKKMPPLWYKWD